MVLLLDNLEQLVPETTIVARLLAAAPRLLVLATSRSRLRLAGEHEYPVPPLGLPRGDRDASFEEIAANDAVRLFVARARAVDPAFELSDEKVHAVSHVCERLDGLPLAIELAAARSSLLSPGAMSRRLDQRLDLLTGGAHDLPARQQTLRSTLEWSYDLLSATERALFTRLAVFAGGWTLDAAEEICGDDGLGVFETLSTLIDENLVRRLASDGETRFGMLETIHEYATERLERSAEAAAFRARHARHVLERIEAASAAYVAGSDALGTYLTLLDEEHDNVRAALAWAAETSDVELQLRLASAARWFWVVRGYLSEGRSVFDAVIEKTADAPAETRARAVGHGGIFPSRQGDIEPAKQLWQEALRLYEELGDEDETGRYTSELGSVAIAEGNLEEATAFLERGAAIFRKTGNKHRLAVVLSNLGAIANLRRDARTAVGYFDEAIAIARESGDQDGLAIALHNESRSLMALEELGRARETLAESIAIARRLGYQEVLAYCLGGLAELAMHEDDAENAVTFLGAAESLFGTIGAAVDPDETETQRKVLDFAIERLGADRAEELRAAGAKRRVDELEVAA
jgi:predicted ATPase